MTYKKPMEKLNLREQDIKNYLKLKINSEKK